MHLSGVHLSVSFYFRAKTDNTCNKSNKLGSFPSASGCDSNCLSQERLPGQTELLTFNRNEEQDYTLLNSMTKFQLSSVSVSISPKEKKDKGYKFEIEIIFVYFFFHSLINLTQKGRLSSGEHT